MINNPKLIEKIKNKIRRTTKEQLEQAIKQVDKEIDDMYEYNDIIVNEYEGIYIIPKEYNDFYLHISKNKKIRRNKNIDNNDLRWAA